MKKRFKEGKTVLLPAGAVSSFLVIFLLASSLFAQIPLNGFCRVEQIDVPRNFYEFRLIDIDEDDNDEIILFGSPEKRFVVIDRSDNGYSVAPKFFFFPVSDFGFFNSLEPLGNFYFFVSEKTRKMGLTSFTKKGSMILLNQKSLDSYPAKFLIGDIDKDDKNEAVIFGNNFNGLSVVEQNNYKVLESKIIKNKIFSDLNFIDLDYDGYPDLVGIDLIANSVVLLMNDNNGNYKITRTIPFERDIKNLFTFDFNGDGFTDITVSEENSVAVLFGDSVSSFTERAAIEVPESIEKYRFEDLNGDANPDLIYIDANRKDCRILLSTGKGFAEPLMLTNGKVFTGSHNEASDSSSLYLISPEGKFYSYSKFELTDSVSVKIGGAIDKLYAEKIGKFDFPVFYFIDSYDNTLKILTGNSPDYFAGLYSDDLAEKHNRVDLYRNSDLKYEFHCYSEKGRLVEILNRNIPGTEVKREAVYTSFPILKVISQTDSSISVLEQNKDSLLIENFYRINEHFVNSDVELVDTGFVGKVTFSKSKDLFFYFTKTENGYFFKKYPGNYSVEVTDFFVNPDSAFIQATMILNHVKNESLHVLGGKSKTTYVLIAGKKSKELRGEDDMIPIAKNNDDLKFYGNNKNKAYIYLYDDESHYVYGAEIDKRRKNILFTKITEMKNPGNFLIEKLGKSKYLIYSDTLNNTINFKNIND